MTAAGFYVGITVTTYFGRCLCRGFQAGFPDAQTVALIPVAEASGLAKGLALGPNAADVDDRFPIGFVAGQSPPPPTIPSFEYGFASNTGEPNAIEVEDRFLAPTLALAPAPLSFEYGFAANTGVGDVATDLIPPVIGTVSPDANEAPGDPGAFPALYVDARDVPIVIPVVDADSAIVFVVLSVLFGDQAWWDVYGKRWETIYSGRPLEDGDAAFRDGYAAFSAVTGSGAAGVGFSFSVRQDAGWTARNGLSMPVDIAIQAVDGKGNVLA